MNPSEIETCDRDFCLVCNSKGELLYKKLKDQLFSVSGEWNLSVCPKCRLVWLNPYPQPQELDKIYKTYYTHQKRSVNFLDPLSQYLEKHVFAALGYRDILKRKYIGIGNIPILREYIGLGILKINSSWGNRLLDVGSGNGEFLYKMKKLGWNAEGVETDLKAAEFTKKQYDLVVYHGTLSQVALPADYYDVVTLSHVIEHVFDPEEVLMECKRILKPGGRIILITPNTQSLSHRIFKRNWRGFEVPRHIAIFSVDNMRLLVKKVGFKSDTLTSTARVSRYLYSTSVHMKQGRFAIGAGGNRGYLLALISYGFQVIEEISLFFNSNLGEEIYFVGRKV